MHEQVNQAPAWREINSANYVDIAEWLLHTMAQGY